MRFLQNPGIYETVWLLGLCRPQTWTPSPIPEESMPLTKKSPIANPWKNCFIDISHHIATGLLNKFV